MRGKSRVAPARPCRVKAALKEAKGRSAAHYWIRRSRVKWAARWSKEKIQSGRAVDSAAKAKYFGDEPRPEDEVGEIGALPTSPRPIESLWSKLKRGWFKKRG